MVPVSLTAVTNHNLQPRKASCIRNARRELHLIALIYPYKQFIMRYLQKRIQRRLNLTHQCEHDVDNKQDCT